MADSFGAPPDYKGRIELDPILLDVERLVTALETGVFKLSNTRVHQNLLLHHIGRSMATSAILLCELCNMGGVMDMVIFRTIFFELLVFFTFTLLTLHFAY